MRYISKSNKLFVTEVQFEIAHLKQPKRKRRSIHNDNQDLLALKKHLNVKLTPRHSFLDPQFLLLKRWSNGTEVLDQHHKDDEIDLCYYTSEHASLYVCNDVVS